MGYFALESRCRQILDYLATQEDYRTIENISDVLSFSGNSVRYSLSKINVLLMEQGQDSMDKKYGSGMRLTPKQKKWWTDISNGLDGMDYMFTQDERIAIIVCELLTDRQKFSVDEVARFLKVSRNTVFADLKNMREILEAYKIKLSYDTRNGYILSGDEFVLRSLLLHQFSLLIPLAGQGVLEKFNSKTYSDCREKLRILQKSLAVEYVPGVIDKLTILLLYMYSGFAGEPSFTATQRKEINSSKEFAAVNEHFFDLPDTEKTYLACQLLGNRIIKPYTYLEAANQQSFSSAKNLVVYFERLTGVVLDDQESLIHDLADHISRALYRYKYGISLKEQIDDSFRHEQAELYSIVRIAATGFSQDIGYPIDDHELLLLTAYFYNHLQQIPFQIEYMPTLLIVEERLKHDKYIAEAVAAAMPVLKIQAVITPEEFYEMKDGRELLISTTPLQTGRIYALIDERMEKNSRDAIARCYMKYRLGRSLDEIEDLMQRLRPYLNKDGVMKAKAEIISFLYGETYTLRDILQPGYVQAGLTAGSWEDAVRKAAAPILADNAITPGYIEAMIRSISMYGSYSYITDGIYLAHAEIGGNVNRLSMGISTFSQPILFPDGKPVRILLVMCPIDKHSHFNAFKEVVGICTRKEAVRSLVEAGSSEELLRTLLNTIQ